MILTRKPLKVDIVCFIHHINSTDWQTFNHFFKGFRKDRKICFHDRQREGSEMSIVILTVTSPIVINVPTRGLLAVETKDSFALWLAKFKYQKTCL